MSGQVDGRAVRWQQHNERRRRTIIEAAIAVAEEQPRGAEMNVAQVAAKAGMTRPAIYRHFADRAELDRAVQLRVNEMLLEAVVSPALFTGTFREVVERLVNAYVGWADEHSSLHHLALGADPGAHGNPARGTIATLIRTVRPIIVSGAKAAGATLTEDDEDALDLLIVGMVAQGVASVRTWLSRPRRAPAREVYAAMLADTVWFQLEGHVRVRGGELSRELGMEQVLGTFFEDLDLDELARLRDA